MTRRERLMATLRGEPVDRPAVSFYEVGGWNLDPDDPDPYNVYNAPDWRPVLDLARHETDIIRLIEPGFRPASGNLRDEFFATETCEQGTARHTRTTVSVGGRLLTSRTVREKSINTIWETEHLLKSVDDAEAYLQLPDEAFAGTYDVASLTREEQILGDAGIVMVDMADPLCVAGMMFRLEHYLVIALTEQALFHRLLEQASRRILPMVETVARSFPGRLWRIYGSEIASAPYLPPRLYEEYWSRYTRPIIETIHREGGYARVHSHGRLRGILPLIHATGADGLDPIEPPPQGDVKLSEVRRDYGRDLVLFGNIEASDIENLPPREFEKKVHAALREGTHGEGRGFVLHPSAAPYGRALTPHTLVNYETMVRCAKGFGE